MECRPLQYPGCCGRGDCKEIVSANPSNISSLPVSMYWLTCSLTHSRIEDEERMDYLMQSILLKRYATIRDGEPTNVANAVERAVDLHALRVIGSSGYQKTVQ